MTVGAEDLLRSAELCRSTLARLAGRDWEVAAGDLDATCRETLDHVVSALTSYASHLANRAPARLPRLRKHDPEAPLEDVLSLVPTAAAVLAAVARSSAPAVRAFHPAGMADPEGFLAMGCDEMLVHTGDIAAGLRVTFTPAPELCARVVARLFPWAPADTEPWATLLWANGRALLGDRPRLDPDWHWHCAPLSEWDGTVKRRTTPPSWAP